MATRPLIYYPKKILTQPTKKVGRITDAIHALIADMVDTMHKERGVGLAAPQIGSTLRICVLEHVPEATEDADTAVPLQILINPKIISRSATQNMQSEGCLSIPGIDVEVPRSTKVKVKAKTPEGESIQFRATGFHARILQHEVDHLDGKLIIDYASNKKKLLAEYNEQ